MRTHTKKLTKGFTQPVTKLQAGFTIIEVLIVLAIAGLILAIIFLAVPALQRNSRNTSIRSDAAAILAGVNDFVANNQGQLPIVNGGAITCTNGTVSITGAAGTTASEAKVRGGTGCSGSAAQPATPPNQLGTIVIGVNNKCTGNTFAGANRAVAATFLIENTGSGTALQCIES